MKKRVMRSVCAFTLLFALLMTSNGVSNVASVNCRKEEDSETEKQTEEGNSEVEQQKQKNCNS